CHAPSHEIVPQHITCKQRGMERLATGGRVAMHWNQSGTSSDIGAHRENARALCQAGSRQWGSGHPADAGDVEGWSAHPTFLFLLFEWEYGFALSSFSLGRICAVRSWAGIFVCTKAAGPCWLHLARCADRHRGHGRGILLEQASIHSLRECRLLENKSEPVPDENWLCLHNSCGAYVSNPKNRLAAAGRAVGGAGIMDHLHHPHLHPLRFHL